MPAVTASVTDRVRYLMSLTRRNQYRFSKLINIDPSNLSKVLTGRMPVGDTFINRIVANLDVSKEWLTTGQGVPFPRKADLPTASAGATASVQAIGAPVYDIDVTAGCVPLDSAFVDNKPVGRLLMPGVNPQYPVVRVSGNSMEPRILNGSFVSVRPVSTDGNLFWGRIYLVELDDYRMIKEVKRNYDNPEMVVLHSINPAYDDMDVRRCDIRRLYVVEMVLNYDILG